MRKPAINFSIDILAFLGFIFLISTGFLIYWVLPAGSGNLSVWGMIRHDWGSIHFWIAVSFVTLIALHLILHWSWIKNMVRGKVKDQKISRFRITITIISLIVILLLAISPFLSTVDQTEKERRNQPAVEIRK